METATRFGISMNQKLLKEFDNLISKLGYKNRSEAIRDLIREKLVQQEWQLTTEETVGTITIVYSHEVRELTETLTAIQHRYHKQIISTMHIHLDKHNCLEVLVVRGKAKTIKHIADRLLSTRGVKHGKLTTTTTGRKLR
ncbi:MAG TPA: nickel-responsive transcriptional regulator NikR [candidate division WOR-3 bacterium]|uniref:Putative nickel-responsive regulator n=1 Tax=candidate division WOR-3 bacterium TaxID=2052148 RepID=A0A9C9JZ78_UNCW3|nr:nickel-responsive transcriptional regulator NikR [candidate division WOR-3 bacterium]